MMIARLVQSGSPKCALLTVRISSTRIWDVALREFVGLRFAQLAQQVAQLLAGPQPIARQLPHAGEDAGRRSCR